MDAIDPIELELVAELDRCRAELIVRAESFARSARGVFDPRERLRERGMGAALLSTVSGMLIGLLPSRRRSHSSDRGDSSGTGQAVLGIAQDLLKDLGPAFLTSIIAHLIGSTKESQKPPTAES